MDPIKLLLQSGDAAIRPDEEAQLASALTLAYHKDEEAATDPGIQRIAEKVRARLEELSSEDPLSLP